MKKLLVAPALLALLCGYQLVTSCSNPLDTTPKAVTVEPFNTTDTLRVIDTVVVADTGGCPDTVIVRDTVVVSDSVVHSDTVVVMDTVYQHSVDTLYQTVVDTLRIVDTVIQVDTVVVVEHDSSGSCNRMCEQLNSHQKKIVWMLQNASGHYKLVFTGDAERNQPPQTLLVNINGKTYRWTVKDQHELTIETDLCKDTKITVTVDDPKACGHDITVCLSYSPM